MSRLQIGKAENYLDLKRDTSIQIDAQSPLWFGDRQGDVLPNVKIYSFSLPSTPYNRILLNRPELLDNSDDFLAEDDWLILYDGKIIERGRLEVEEAMNEGGDYKATFIGGIAGKLYALKDLDISTISYGEVETIGKDSGQVLDHAKAVTLNPDDYDYLFPTIRIAKEEGDNNYLHLNYYYEDEFRTSSVEGQNTFTSSLAPQLRLKFVLEKVLEHVGYDLRGIFDSSQYREELRNLLLFNNVTLDQTEIQNSVTVQKNDINLKTDLNLSEHVPPLAANDFLRAVADTFALAIIPSILGRTISLLPYDYALKGKSVDWTNIVQPQYTKTRRSEALPFGFGYHHFGEDYGEQTKAVLNGRSVDMTFERLGERELTEADLEKIIYVKSKNEYIVYKRAFRVSGDDFQFSTSTFPISLGREFLRINGDSSNVFTPASDTLHMYHELGIVHYFSPAYFNGVVSPLYGNIARNDKAIFLFYRGLYPRFASNPNLVYPLATSNNYNQPQEKVGELSLLWNGEAGLYNRWWKTWHEALQRMRPVTMTARLTATDLEQLDWMSRIEVDGKLFLLRRIQITLTTTQINVANIELMQLL